ncbi:MAG: DEAD/DEAH box helicase [Saprospiraceae bacterium]|nr:DEAD/DEAH box helicase [Saprospiraceae bacterium]
MTFADLGVIPPILKALEVQGYSQPTPIQTQAIPSLLDGSDLLGCAQTGTGKTAAFAIPIIQQLALRKDRQAAPRKIRALVVSPTRELAIQIGEQFSAYGRYTNVNNTVIFGGVKQGAQTRILRNGVDILIATPGRLLDLIGQGFVHLGEVDYVVLDEADHMLDMGFIHDIRKIIKLLPKKRQSLFFSATMPPEIIKLSANILGKPKKITIQPKQQTAELVDQGLLHVSKKNKAKLLTHILQSNNYDSTLVFSRTKHGANKIVRILNKQGIAAKAIHGNKSQVARQKALDSFKKGHTNVLVATDIAARGIDVEELSLVVNYDLPNVPETYVHRIGRTGRAKASGIALSFCSPEENVCLKDIEKLLKKRIRVIEDHPFVNDVPDISEQHSAPQRSVPHTSQNNGPRPSRKVHSRNRRRSYR